MKKIKETCEASVTLVIMGVLAGFILGHLFTIIALSVPVGQ
jgi:hypothetical protein